MLAAAALAQVPSLPAQARSVAQASVDELTELLDAAPLTRSFLNTAPPDKQGRTEVT